MKKLLVLGVVVAAATAGWWMMRPSGFDTDAPLTSDGTPIDLLADLDTDDIGAGWVHRKFLTVSAASYEVTDIAGDTALLCETNDSASILARDTDIAVADLPILTWEWQIIDPIDSNVDEATEEGDDHPARFFVVFSNEADERRAMEIIWSNQKFAPGEYKIIGDFYHYVANGLSENVGAWHTQQVDLREIYADIGGTGTPKLQALGFFCDSDNTGTQSSAMFKNVMLSADGA